MSDEEWIKTREDSRRVKFTNQELPADVAFITAQLEGNKVASTNAARLFSLKSIFVFPTDSRFMQQAAYHESEPIAESDYAVKTLSLLSDSPTVSRSVRMTSRSPGMKVRAYFLRGRPTPGSACRSRHARTGSRTACRVT